MGEFYALRRELLVTTAAFGGVIFPAVWYFYDRNVALNYLLGAATGIAYLKLLGRNVERLGTEQQRWGSPILLCWWGFWSSLLGLMDSISSLCLWVF